MKKIFLILGFFIVIIVLFFLLSNQFSKKIEVLPVVNNTIEKEFYEMELSLPQNKSDSKKYGEMFSWISKQISDFDKEFGSISEEDLEVLGLKDGRKYQFTINTKVSTSTNTVSYLISVYRFTGGAHGSTEAASFTYDNNGKFVSNQDLFISEDWKNLISEKARSYFREKFSNEGYLNEDFLNSGTEPNLDNFNTWYISSNKIVFVFSQYSIGPGVLGEQEFSIDKEEIKDFINKRFK